MIVSRIIAGIVSIIYICSCPALAASTATLRCFADRWRDGEYLQQRARVRIQPSDVGPVWQAELASAAGRSPIWQDSERQWRTPTDSEATTIPEWQLMITGWSLAPEWQLRLDDGRQIALTTVLMPRDAVPVLSCREFEYRIHNRFAVGPRIHGEGRACLRDGEVLPLLHRGQLHMIDPMRGEQQLRFAAAAEDVWSP